MNAHSQSPAINQHEMVTTLGAVTDKVYLNAKPSSLALN
jgi:hypothetical protein